MLSPHDDDDDNHLCIKCNATIIGLDNYVKHRKQNCGKGKTNPKSDLPSIDPLEPTYSLGADVFFQSLELQSSVKKSPLSGLTPSTLTSKVNTDKKSALAVSSTSRDLPRMSPIESNLRGEDWIGGHSLRIGSNEDNQTKLINAVASISGSVKKDLPSTSYNIATYNDYKGDDESEESETSEDDDEEEPHGGKWKPPPNYTGGKWRPASPEHEDWDIRDEQYHDRNYDYDAPPPGHTKGKWVPGANEKTQIMQTTIQSKGSVQYWCGPCNRRLGSRTIYEKHLMSNLHMRKVLPEHELEFSGHLEPIRSIEKRSARPSAFVADTTSSQPQKKKQKLTEPTINIKMRKKKRKRRSYFIQCSGCKSRVRTHLMGKHLISHYHFRKATNIKSDAYDRELILNNIEAIVHQAPFQCSPCKFYTNWLSNFMQHWYSEEHELTVTSIEGRYWCSFCKFECETSQEMLNHMSSSEHSGVVAVINRSMPIIIRKKTILRCSTCEIEFRYNREIKQHCSKTGHELAYSATDNYQELHRCQHCKQKFKSSVTLAAHLKSRHKQKAFSCLVCSKTFKTSEEAKVHRQTSEHRVRRKENMCKRGVDLPYDLSKKCPYCTEKVILKNILELKDHIRRVHPNIRKKCPKCGKSFIFSQEVTRHIRAKACQFQKPEALNSSLLWNCSQCIFTTDSQAECFFHEVIHTEPLKETKSGTNKLIEKYSCPLCPKTFKKASLRLHLRQHTFERPFVCTICEANFTRQSSLANHSKSEHGELNREPKLAAPGVSITKLSQETVSCTKCKKTFTDGLALTHHAVSCAADERRCPHDQCTYIASSAALLNRHRRTHGECVKQYDCPMCVFRTDQASHLKRHLVCHEGVKPYGCPHCQFTCGSLENLRKHVLRSGRHSGLPLYSCPTCSYNTNLATELRTHYTTIHPDKYDARSALEAVKLHLMKCD